MNDLSRRQLFRAAGGLAVVGLASACTTSVNGSAVPVPHPTPVTPPGPPNNLAKARQSGTVGVMAIANNQPFSYSDPAAPGGLTGESIEVIREVFVAIGVPTVKYVLIDFPGAQQKMMAMAAAGDDSYAVFAGGVIFNSQYCQGFDQVPDFQYLIAFGVPKGNPKNIKGINDVLQGKRTVATITGATLEPYLEASGVPSTSIKRFPESTSALRAVAQGQADCFPFYDISLRQLVANGGPVQGMEVTEGFELPGLGPKVSGYQFIKQDDTSIRDAFTAQLATMKQNGQWLQIANRFGLTQANDVPSSFSIDQVCH